MQFEKEAHARMCQELEELKGVLAGLSAGTPTVGRAVDPGSLIMPSTRTVPIQMNASDTIEASVSLEEGTSVTHQPTEVESASPIAKQVRNDPRTRHPSMLQTSPYVNPITHVYNPRKRQRCPEHEPVVEPRPLKVEGDQGGQPPKEASGTPPVAVGMDTVTQSQSPLPCSSDPKAGPANGDVFVMP